jgi:predicted phage-related endonuclease
MIIDSPFSKGRRAFIGGSDARIIMGNDEGALLRLWREKRGEVEPKDLSGNLIVQLGLVTEDLNRRWYEANTGQVITDIQRRIRHPTVRWMGATLDGRIQGSEASIRGQVHAALVILRSSRRREVHVTTAAQYVGRGGKNGGALDHYRRR